MAGTNYVNSVAQNTPTTPTLDELLNPFEILVNSEGITDDQIADKLNDINDLKGVTQNPCSADRIDDLTCLDNPSPVDAGSEPFAFGVTDKIYINNYEIIVTAGDAARGEGLLYLPLVKTRIPVEWQGLTVNKSLNEDYGCVIAGEVAMQGSQTGAISNDLYRQVMALLTQGPEQWSGKLGDSFDAFEKIIDEIEQSDNPSPDLLKKFQNIGVQVIKAIDAWTPLLDGFDGNPAADNAKALIAGYRGLLHIWG